MIILGIGGLLNDAASAILVDGQLAAAVEESKIVRRGARRAASCLTNPSPRVWSWRGCVRTRWTALRW